MRDCRIQRDATYLLEEARGQVLVNGEVTLLLLSQTRGRLLYPIQTESVKVKQRIRADSTASGEALGTHSRGSESRSDRTTAGKLEHDVKDVRGEGGWGRKKSRGQCIQEPLEERVKSGSGEQLSFSRDDIASR